MKILVSAGGTGGHIYPALSIINKFKEKETDLEVLYIGTHNRMEKDIIPAAGIKYEPIEIYGFTKNMKQNIKNIGLISKAKKRCLEIMENFKPDVVIGVGGYVTYPVIWAANKLGIKTFLHEQNSLPGKTNKMLARKATKVGVSFPETVKHFPKEKVLYTGNPCGEAALKAEKVSKNALGLSEDKKLVVVVAGSLGSVTVNEKMQNFLLSIDKESYEVVYITGKNYYEDFKKDLIVPKNVKILPYFDNLPTLLKATDLLVTRAGASTMSEVLALNLPAIFIPSPYVANNHQYYNALELKNKNAGELIEEKDLTSEKLKMKIDSILNDREKYKLIKESLASISTVDSSEIIYKTIKEMIK